MARGNCIVVSAEPRGSFKEGYIGASYTPLPGTVLQRDPTVAIKGGVHTYIPYQPGADGGKPKGPIYVLRENYLLGQTSGTAYAAGDRCFLYVPEAGDELNMVVADVAGTGDVHALGEILMPQNGTGKLVVSNSTQLCAPFQLQEAIAAPTADVLAWVIFNGY